ncbi:MAG: hypothetical protein Q9186_001713 [Xanthomendoza sp. 1 TL-2023]
MSGASSSSSAPSNGPTHHPAIREISLEESDAAADALALAFADDDVAMYFVRMHETEGWSDEERWNMHVRIMRSIVKAHCLKGLVLTIGPNYDCVALCSTWSMNGKRSVEGQYRFQKEFLPLLHDTKQQVLGSLDNDSWYLVYIGTKPGSRGKGYAKQLIDHVTRQADDQGRVCYLESSNEVNPRFYRKLGFETEKTIHLTRGPKPIELEVMVRKSTPKGSPDETSAECGQTIKMT